MSGDVMRPEPWENPDPEHYHFEPAVEDGRRGLEWRIRTDEHAMCRRIDHGQRCLNTAVAEINRGHRRQQWWAYCAEHMYGRWIEDGQVWQWRLVENEPR